VVIEGTVVNCENICFLGEKPMFRFRCLHAKALLLCGIVSVACSGPALAAITAPGLIKDINPNTSGQQDIIAADPAAQGPNFSPGSNAFASAGGVPYGIDTNGALNGNDVLVVTQSGFSNNTGAGFTIHVSNGENGTNYAYNANPGGPAGSNPSNLVPADPAFAAIGNPSGRLEDGNVIRFSVWVRNDALAPMTVEPQITPILKLEFWRDALSGDADFTGGVTNPGWGSRIFDTDQNDVAIADPDGRKRLIDINGDGQWFWGTATEPVPSTTEWQQVVHTYTVNSAGEVWDILNTPELEDVTQVEEIRGVMFVGDYNGTAFGDPGNLLWDNALIEVFRNTAAEAASDVLASNPSPLLDEGAGNGDFNGDGLVDGRDLLLWQRGGSPNLLSSADLELWKSTYGEGALAAVSAIPEPSSIVLVLGCVFVLSGAKRSRS
jgi:hypothetical protein